tara:strand:+ start:1156 stop:1407 length:252 start_codon:yes stop_codon:yes gene_type:complete
MSENKFDNNILQKVVSIEGELKTSIVNYVGSKINPPSGEVTLEMVINCIAEEFPEVLLVVAEENFLRGYEVGLSDTSSLKLES